MSKYYCKCWCLEEIKAKLISAVNVSTTNLLYLSTLLICRTTNLCKSFALDRLVLKNLIEFLSIINEAALY